MNRSQFLILVVVLAVLAAAGGGVMWWQRADWRTTDSRVGQRLIPGLTIANISELRLQEAGGAVTLARKDEAWLVRERADFPANLDRIGELLVKLADLKIAQIEPLDDSQRPRLQLVEPKGAQTKEAGTLVELKDKDGKALAQLLLGKKVVKQAQTTAPTKGVPDPSGRYVLGGERGSVAVVSDALSQAEAKPELWIAKDLIRVQGAKTMISTRGDGKQGWSVTRQSESADWKFADSSDKLDNNKVQDLVSVLIYIALADVATDTSSAGFEKGVTLRIQTFDNLTYTLRLGNLEGEKRYVKVAVSGELPKARAPGKKESPEEKEKQDKAFEENMQVLRDRFVREKTREGWTYLVQNSDIQSLLRDRAALLPEKKTDEKKKDGKKKS